MAGEATQLASSPDSTVIIPSFVNHSVITSYQLPVKPQLAIRWLSSFVTTMASSLHVIPSSQPLLVIVVP